MSGIAAIGNSHALDGFVLVGVCIRHAADDAAVADEWRALDPDVGLVIFTADSYRAIQPLLDERPTTLTVAMP